MAGLWIAAVDVDYRDDGAVAAAVCFDRWQAQAQAQAPATERVVRIDAVAPYRPGRFFERELPALLSVLEGVHSDVVIVDGYVWLRAPGQRPGLGAYLHAALEEGSRPVVIGVAKNRFAGAESMEVLRGGSARPLYVTPVGIGQDEAAAAIHAMHGAHRFPTLLGRVDRLARQR